MSNSSSRARAITFAYLWVASGFVLGTLMLFGPVRWITNVLRARGAGQAVESTVVLVMIGLLIFISINVARAISGPATAAGWNARRISALAIPGVLALAVTGLWMNPNLMVQKISLAGPPSHFFIGPYPQEADLERIKENGYTAVISLLHPAVVPFEPKLIRDERAAAGRAGIELIEVPMLPWVSGNGEALEKIRQLASDTAARYYVHCYLGKDRVNVVRRSLVAMQVAVSGATGQSARSLDSVKTFERGPVEHLGNGVHLTPFPSDEEYFGYLIAGGVRTIVSLLDPANPEDAPWIAKEKQLASVHKLFVVQKPMPVNVAAAARASVIVQEIAGLPKPMVIYGFSTPSPSTNAIRDAYQKSVH